ncbi:Daunorubicin/doxorubicin resistance ATP-binding protein DrrA [Alloiococcus otitis]|uniref:Daunorubicin resistance ABC transporter, ATP-binding protein n=1 Tax=Alloiococcus otitis ATCC 51267 TaxID=883081 RepID=K9ESZ9_9LACT|nr:daunorubicin resistance protein DrrA family ABC transporter ATP-binding protein [Alloiococcus otitis]EKU94097.1 daunorubicin resistance ABC transporter, ATP-binding protein [Alloiococcus otitis ATCC 51267]SUU80989.1 Daunorubicin/doxorubicin resistance ATP-binding protein DrrA [Alloiococcus otitis]
MLEARQINKSFKKFQAVKDLSLHLEEGESVGLLGPNGAGKSTTISILSTLMQANSGSLIYKGEDCFKNPKPLRQALGLVPQEIALYPELTAYENLKFFGKVYQLKGKDLEDRIQTILEEIGLKDRQKERVTNYSGGMKRRLNIGVALIQAPQILVMDEPTVGIDPQSRSHILDMVKKLNQSQGMTVLYTSHYMEEVEKLCDRVYIMDHGEIIAAGTIDDLKSILNNEKSIQVDLVQKSSSFKEKLLDQANINQVLDTERGYQLIASNEKETMTQVFEIAHQLNLEINRLSIHNPSLEDVFLHLTGRRLRD